MDATAATTPIQEFYRGANVFISGGTGFMGKLLVEKLIRSCPGIGTIYLLVREKKGKNVEQRIDEYFTDAVFARIDEQVPGYKEKIVSVSGDCAIAGLGLGARDRETLCERVNVVFHVAATVRFDEELRLAVAINVGGTRDILDLGHSMKNLKALIHVSTAYSNCHLKEIDEMFYNHHMIYEELTQILDKIDDQAIQDMTPQIIGKWPNTYTFTKAIAESFVQNCSKNLPIGVFRPSIVTSTYKEPVAGWVDNLYGPMGACVAASVGFLKSMNCYTDMVVDVIPADLCINALIVSAWDVVNRTNDAANNGIPIYNYVSSVDKPITWGEFNEVNVIFGKKYPIPNAIRPLSFTMYENKFLYSLSMFVEHKVPALLLDFVSYLTGHQTKFFKIFLKLEKYCNAVQYFATRSWVFKNKNTKAMWDKLNEKDKELFNFNIRSIDWFEYCNSYICGLRQYIFKLDEATLKASRIRQMRLYYGHQIIHYIFSFLAVFGVWKAILRMKKSVMNMVKY